MTLICLILAYKSRSNDDRFAGFLIFSFIMMAFNIAIINLLLG